MDDAPARSFGDWLACSVEVARGNYMDVDDDTLPKLLADTVIAFLQLGKAVGEDTAETANQKLAEWETRCARASSTAHDSSGLGASQGSYRHALQV